MTRPNLFPWLGFIASLVVLLMACHSTVQDMVSIWIRSETYAHAFVVPPLSAWMVWRLRAELAALPARSSAWALLPLSLVLVAWLAGVMTVTNAVAQTALVLMIILLVPLHFGWVVARALLFPLAFLLFAVPLGDALTPVLMQWTADFTIAALRLSGVPVYREGLQFIIPSGHWSVVEACSGIRYLMASFMVGSLFAYLNYRSARRRVLFAVVSIVLPIVANWLRAYMIVMLGHLSNNAIATGADHLLYGWVFFGVVIVAMFMVGARWAEAPAAVCSSAEDTERGSESGPGHSTTAHGWLAVAVAVLFVAAWGVQRTEPTQLPDAPMPPLRVQLRGTSGWMPVESAPAAWEPVFIGPTRTLSQTYRHDDLHVGLHIGYYAQQTAGRKLVNSRNVLVKSMDPSWQQLTHDERLPGGVAAAVDAPWRASHLLEAASQTGTVRRQLLAWRVYWVDGHLTHSDVAAKLLGLWRRVRGLSDSGASLVIFVDQTGTPAAEAALVRFWRDNRGDIEAALRAVDSGQNGRP